MKLRQASRYFDRSKFTDAYDEKVRLRAQLDPLDYYKIDGATVKRRVMSTDPSVTMPLRHTLRIDDQVFITGDVAVDYWLGKPVRHRYVLQGADDLAVLRTIAEVLADASGTEAYTSKVWSKYETDSRVSSDYINEYHLYFAAGEPLLERQIILCDEAWYFVRGVHQAQSGLLDCITHRLPADPREDVEFHTRSYDPVTDVTASVTTTVASVTLRWQDDFQYLSLGSTDYERGDAQVWVLASAVPAPKSGDLVELAGKPHRVLSTRVEGTCHSLHVRPS